MKTSMIFRKAALSDLTAVTAIYEEIHDAEEAGSAVIGWARRVYPTEETARAALSRGDLYVEEDDSCIVGAAIINQLQVDCYRQGAWTQETPDDRVLVLHTLVISPKAGGRGRGRAFAEFYEQLARDLGCTALRIDTNARNERARRMYAALGYKEVGIAPTVFNGIPGVQLVLLEKLL